MNLNDFQKKKKQLPDTPGVYFFLGPKREVLYIGKATSLRDRVRSYFSPDLAVARSPLVVQMVEKARSIDWRETDSVLEALILEASLIKTYKPHHNTLEKDDKSFNYVVITDEEFPRVLVKRGKELGGLPPLPSRGEGGGEGCRSNPSEPFKAIFGPFPHGVQLKEAMKIIRKIFPFRDKCEPCEDIKNEKIKKICRPCFNRQIGLCPGVCSGEVSAAEYRRTIRHIRLFLGGHKKKLLTALESEMKKAAKAERFEEAARLRVAPARAARFAHALPASGQAQCVRHIPTERCAPAATPPAPGTRCACGWTRRRTATALTTAPATSRST